MKHYYVLAKGEFVGDSLYVECDDSRDDRSFIVDKLGGYRPSVAWTFARCIETVGRGQWREITLAEVLTLRDRHQLRHLDVDHGLAEPDPTKDVPATAAQVVW